MKTNLTDCDCQEDPPFAQLSYRHFHDRSFSFQILLQQQLLTAAIKYIEKYILPTIHNNYSLLDKINKINLYLDRNVRGYFYRSAICFCLASYARSSPIDIARHLREILNESPRTQLDELEIKELIFTVEANETGWLDFFPTDRTVAIWLDRLFFIDFPTWNLTLSKECNVFLVRYSHDRTHSLLNLAARQKTIDLDFRHDRLARSHSTIYLKPEENSLIFEDALELNLITVLLKTFDFLMGRYTEPQLLKMAFFLSESFLDFYDRRPLFYPQKQDNRQSIVARWRIIAAIEFLLEQMLIRLDIEKTND
jgi:hypothetical protein